MNIKLILSNKINQDVSDKLEKMDINCENSNKKDINKEKQDKKDQFEKDLILAEREYYALFESVNKRRANYLEQEFKKKNKE
jgi:hypothetical protein